MDRITKKLFLEFPEYQNLDSTFIIVFESKRKMRFSNSVSSGIFLFAFHLNDQSVGERWVLKSACAAGLLDDGLCVIHTAYFISMGVHGLVHMCEELQDPLARLFL